MTKGVRVTTSRMTTEPLSAGESHFRMELQPGDEQAVRAVVAATGFFHAQEIDVAVELVSERRSKGAASGYEFLFAERGGRVIGYACYGEIACTVGSYDLYWIAVHPEAQGGGLGRRLLRETEAIVAARGGRAIYVETSGRSQYEPTRRFYLRSSYRVVATLPDFYAAGDDKIVLAKRLA